MRNCKNVILYLPTKNLTDLLPEDESIILAYIIEITV